MLNSDCQAKSVQYMFVYAALSINIIISLNEQTRHYSLCLPHEAHSLNSQTTQSKIVHRYEK